MNRGTILLVGLALSLAACADSSTVGGSGTGTAGIQGQVLLGPMCPVMQSDSPCPDRPIKADITVTSPDGKTVATGHSDGDGSYRISLPPGSYTVTAKRPGSGGIGSGKPVTVEVPVSTYVHLNLLIDSGIR